MTGGQSGVRAKNYGSGPMTITTYGEVVDGNAHGILAQNLDSSGAQPVTVIAMDDVSGSFRGIEVRNDSLSASTIVAHGDVIGGTSHGIFARNTAIGGAGAIDITTYGAVSGGLSGIRARNYSGDGAVAILAYGDITGISGDGIYARAGDNAPISVVLGPGATVAGATAGVVIVGGTNNAIANRGTITTFAGPSGPAIISGTGNETVDNFGVVTGNVVLGAGTNSFNNFAAATFNSGAIVDLGAGNLLTNHGTLAPGGAGNVLTTVLTGNLTQPGSAFAVDIDGSEADRVSVSGSASMAGLVKPKLLNLDGTTRWTIMTSGSGPIDNGVTVNDTLFVDYELLFPSATEMVLAVAALDFSLERLNRNETAIAENLNQVFASGDASGVQTLLAALANLPNVGALANALDQLSPEIYLDTEIATLFSSLTFTNSLMTCPVRDGAAAFIKEGECVWARLSGREFDQDQTFQTLGFEETSFEVAGGLQGALGDVWRIGFDGAYEHGSLDTDETFATSDSDRAHAGAVLKYNPGASPSRRSGLRRLGLVRHRAADRLRRLLGSAQVGPRDRLCRRPPPRRISLERRLLVREDPDRSRRHPYQPQLCERKRRRRHRSERARQQ